MTNIEKAIFKALDDKVGCDLIIAHDEIQRAFWFISMAEYYRISQKWFNS